VCRWRVAAARGAIEIQARAKLWEAELEGADRLHRQLQLVQQVEGLAGMLSAVRKAWAYTLITLWGQTGSYRARERAVYRWTLRAKRHHATWSMQEASGRQESLVARVARAEAGRDLLEGDLASLREETSLWEEENVRLKEEAHRMIAAQEGSVRDMGALEEHIASLQARAEATERDEKAAYDSVMAGKDAALFRLEDSLREARKRVVHKESAMNCLEKELDVAAQVGEVTQEALRSLSEENQERREQGKSRIGEVNSLLAELATKDEALGESEEASSMLSQAVEGGKRYQDKLARDLEDACRIKEALALEAQRLREEVTQAEARHAADQRDIETLARELATTEARARETEAELEARLGGPHPLEEELAEALMQNTEMEMAIERLERENVSLQQAARGEPTAAAVLTASVRSLAAMGGQGEGSLSASGAVDLNHAFEEADLNGDGVIDRLEWSKASDKVSQRLLSSRKQGLETIPALHAVVGSLETRLHQAKAERKLLEVAHETELARAYRAMEVQESNHTALVSERDARLLARDAAIDEMQRLHKDEMAVVQQEMAQSHVQELKAHSGIIRSAAAEESSEVVEALAAAHNEIEEVNAAVDSMRQANHRLIQENQEPS